MDRTLVDKAAGWLTKAVALFSLCILLLMIVGLLVKSGGILESNSLPGLLLSSDWHPSKGEFGFFPYITGTFIVTILSMVFSVPVCFFSAIYLTQYSGKRFQSLVKSGIDNLAGIPSVVFGLWGVLFIVPGPGSHSPALRR